MIGHSRRLSQPTRCRDGSSTQTSAETRALEDTLDHTDFAETEHPILKRQNTRSPRVRVGRCPECAASRTGLSGDRKMGTVPAYFPFSLFSRFLALPPPRLVWTSGQRPACRRQDGVTFTWAAFCYPVSAAHAGTSHPTVSNPWRPAGVRVCCAPSRPDGGSITVPGGSRHGGSPEGRSVGSWRERKGERGFGKEPAKIPNIWKS